MMHERSPRLSPVHLKRRPHQVAIAAIGLIIALAATLGGANRALARTAPDRARDVTAARPPAPRQTTTTVPAAPPAPAHESRPPVPVVPGQEATVEIPSLGITLPVVRGGQDVIDRGVAAHYTGPQWLPPTDPGRPGTYWLAAHNSTHGSPFADLPAIADGAEVRIVELNGPVYTYVVTSRDLVGTATTVENVYGADPTVPRLLLQTCEGAAQRLLVHGTLVSVEPA